MWACAGCVQSSCFRYVCFTKLLCCSLNALRIFEKLNGEAANDISSATRGVLGSIHLYKTALPSAGEESLLLYEETTAAYKREWKQKAIFKSFVFYLYAASLL